MIFTSKNVSLLIATFVGILTTGSCLFFETSGFISFVIVGLSSFFSTYMITYMLFEFVLFKELKNVYQKIVNLEDLSRNGLVRSMEDFSFRKMSNELFHYSETKTKELKKMKEVELFRRQFLADIAHELKTPVHTAQGFVETLIDGAMDDLEVRDRFLKKTSKSLSSLNFIINDLISISHLETGEIRLDIEPVNVVEILQKVVNHLEGKAKKKKHKLRLEIEKGVDFTVMVDSFRIDQVVTNLVSNAINYSGEEKDICVKISKDSEKKCLIEVIDNGGGIPETHQQQVFNRFYRVDKSRSREHGGTGLGLAIVKHILEAHDSRIDLASKKGEGANFSFKLPFA